MAKGEEVTVKEVIKEKKCGSNIGGGSVYGLGVIGAAIYYLQHTQSFQEGIAGILKAFFWPAFLVYKLIEILKF